jgi:peptide/nickel transport system substrate-binding protein
VDIAYSITGPLAEELKRTSGLTLVPTYIPFTAWLYPSEQWDPKSPWHDVRVRRAANLAIDRDGINQAAYLGLAKVTSSNVPHKMDYFWAPPPPRFDAAQARKLLAEAGYPNGFEAGELSGDTVYGVALG